MMCLMLQISVKFCFNHTPSMEGEQLHDARELNARTPQLRVSNHVPLMHAKKQLVCCIWLNSVKSWQVCECLTKLEDQRYGRQFMCGIHETKQNPTWSKPWNYHKEQHGFNTGYFMTWEAVHIYTSKNKQKIKRKQSLTVCMDWNGAALTLMPPLWGALETGWNTGVCEAGGRTVEGGGCSDKDMEGCWGGKA